MNSLLLGLALLVPPGGQERTPIPSVAAAPTPAVAADAATPRIHPVPVEDSTKILDRAMQVLRDPMASIQERTAAHRDYRAALETGSPLDRARSMAEVVRFVLEPEFEDAPFELEAAAGGRGLLAVATELQHQAIAEVLADLEGDRSMIDLEAAIITVSREELKELTGGRTALSVTRAELAELRAKLEKRDLVTTPRVLVYAGSPARITTGKEYAYIKDFELTVSPAMDREILDPTVDVVFEGLSLDVRAAPRRGKLRVQVSFSSSHVERPFAEKTLNVGPLDHEVTVQVPDVTTIDAKALFDLEQDAAIVLAATDAAGNKDEAALVLLTAEVVEPADQEPLVGEPLDEDR